MNADAYIRVSSRSQDDALQRSAIEREARARGDNIGDRWRAEKRSAKTMDRVELKKLLEDVRAGRVKKLYVFKLDRLCRTGVADTFAVVDELRRAGCILVVVADNVTIVPGKDDITSEVLIFAFGLAAKLERSAINDRIAAAKENVERHGGQWGRPSRVDRKTRERAVALATTVDPKAVQSKLNALGYKPHLVVDGVLGPRSTAGIKWFQASKGLPQTGKVDAATRKALGVKGESVRAIARRLHCPRSTIHRAIAASQKDAPASAPETPSDRAAE